MYAIEDRVDASLELLKRYMVARMSNVVEYNHDGEKRFYNKSIRMGKEQQHNLLKECVEVACMKDLDVGRKRAARVMMEIICGKVNTNDILEGKAVVTKRSDSLVRRWRNKVIERDKECRSCGSDKNLQAHHISRWVDDPVNRINIDNGIALCMDCHVLLHEEHKALMQSRFKE